MQQPSNGARRLIRGLTLLFGAGTIGLVLVMFAIRPAEGLPPGFTSPIAAMELAAGADQVHAILDALATAGQPPGGSLDEARQGVEVQFEQARRFDQYVIVPFYVSLLVLLAWWFAPREGLGGLAAFGAVAVAAILTGLFDTLENTHGMYVIERALADTLTDADVARVRHASVLKWTSLGVSLALVAHVLRSERARLALLWGVAGVCIAAGPFTSPLVIRAGMLAMGGALCWTGWRALAPQS